MKTSRFVGAGLAAAAFTIALNAQTAGSFQHERMLEALRKRVAAERGATVGETPATPATAEQPKQDPTPPASTPAVAPASTDPKDASSYALEVLRSAVANQTGRASAEGSAGTTPKTDTAKPAVPDVAPEATEVGSTAPTPVVEAQPATIARPQTKQERLMVLLELYKADRITPKEYHERRAEIVAEP